jgi:N6-L-threonylcarbamoyladenine synthase
MDQSPTIILGIESSCDDTSAAIIKDGKILSNVIANQAIHEAYGGVVPELASRAHQQNIIPVVNEAIKQAGITKENISAIAFTNGPGLLGSLLVGSSFAKAFALGMNIPLIEINHMHGHILAHFIEEEDGENNKPNFPFICLTVSGGHTQIVKVTDYFKMEILGETIDDAAGEAFDKVAKMLSLPYPGGPILDKKAQLGNPNKYKFTHPKVPGFNYSFSGLKTSVLYFLKRELKLNENFITENMNDICASVQKTIVDILIIELKKAIAETGIKDIAIAGGVSANSELRKRLASFGQNHNVFIPKFEYCTDNAAMIAIAGYYKFLDNDFTDQGVSPNARMKV